MVMARGTRRNSAGTLRSKRSNVGRDECERCYTFICLFFVLTRSYNSSITLMNDRSLGQNGG
jgi:hypothetical protein